MERFDEIRLQLMSTFQAELEDHLNTLNLGILALEQNPEGEQRAAILIEVFRAAHTLKGAARAVEVKDIETLAHKLEDLLDMIRADQFILTSQHINLLLAMVDAIKDANTAFLHDGALPNAQPLHPAEPRNRQEPSLTNQAPPQTKEEDVSIKTREYRNPIQDSPPDPSGKGTGDRSPPQPVSRLMAVDETIRVATSKLDVLMDNLGELVLASMRTDQEVEQISMLHQQVTLWQKKWRKLAPLYRRLRKQNKQELGADMRGLMTFLEQNETELKMTVNELNNLVGCLKNDRNQIQLVADALENGFHKIRMLPIATLFDIFPRLVHDLAQEGRKEITLSVEGADIQVDRQVLELIKDPLLHLVRNAVDHGIETPDQRLASGKPRQGNIRLCAEQRGGNLVLLVCDDGAGINPELVKQTALKLGMITPAEAARLNEHETLNLIFRPGLSTAKTVTDLSGRGMGMDIVHENLEQLHGLIQVAGQLGQGTVFTITLPLTLSTSQVLLARAGGETLALPMMNVERILRVSVDKIGSLDGKPAIYTHGRPLPLISLAHLLGLPQAEKPLLPNASIPVIVLNVVEKHIALRVDGFLSTRKVVIKQLGRQLRRVKNVAGATILGDGQLVIVLNANDLIQSIQDTPSAAVSPPITIQKIHKRHVLVVDDSITTRMLEKNILENAGYAVSTMTDGQEAWEFIRSHEKETIDLVIADISMPNMDGFMLTHSIKEDPRFAQIPVILVTSLESPQDKLRGLEAGAEAYMTKKYFDQRDLLEMMDRLVG